MNGVVIIQFNSINIFAVFSLVGYVLAHSIFSIFENLKANWESAHFYSYVWEYAFFKGVKIRMQPEVIFQSFFLFPNWYNSSLKLHSFFCWSHRSYFKIFLIPKFSHSIKLKKLKFFVLRSLSPSFISFLISA